MKNPNVVKWSLKYGIMSALAGILCCVAPAILFMFGLMGGIVAISFADFFYSEDGSIGMGSIILRIIGFGIGCIAVFKFREKQNQCSIDPKRKKINLILLVILLLIFGVVFFLAMDSWSAWYFDEYIVPQQQIELNT